MVWHAPFKNESSAGKQGSIQLLGCNMLFSALGAFGWGRGGGRGRGKAKAKLSWINVASREGVCKEGLALLDGGVALVQASVRSPMLFVEGRVQALLAAVMGDGNGEQLLSQVEGARACDVWVEGVAVLCNDIGLDGVLLCGSCFCDNVCSEARVAEAQLPRVDAAVEGALEAHAALAAAAVAEAMLADGLHANVVAAEAEDAQLARICIGLFRAGDGIAGIAGSAGPLFCRVHAIRGLIHVMVVGVGSAAVEERNGREAGPLHDCGVHPFPDLHAVCDAVEPTTCCGQARDAFWVSSQEPQNVFKYLIWQVQQAKRGKLHGAE